MSEREREVWQQAWEKERERGKRETYKRNLEERTRRLLCIHIHTKYSLISQNALTSTLHLGVKILLVHDLNTWTVCFTRPESATAKPNSDTNSMKVKKATSKLYVFIPPDKFHLEDINDYHLIGETGANLYDDRCFKGMKVRWIHCADLI